MTEWQELGNRRYWRGWFSDSGRRRDEAGRIADCAIERHEWDRDLWATISDQIDGLRSVGYHRQIFTATTANFRSPAARDLADVLADIDQLTMAEPEYGSTQPPSAEPGWDAQHAYADPDHGYTYPAPLPWLEGTR